MAAQTTATRQTPTQEARLQVLVSRHSQYRLPNTRDETEKFSDDNHRTPNTENETQKLADDSHKAPNTRDETEKISHDNHKLQQREWDSAQKFCSRQSQRVGWAWSWTRNTNSHDEAGTRERGSCKRLTHPCRLPLKVQPLARAGRQSGHKTPSNTHTQVDAYMRLNDKKTRALLKWCGVVMHAVENKDTV